MALHRTLVALGLVIAWPCLAAPAPAAPATPSLLAPPQEPGTEFTRLSRDQQKLAEQARRLERLLETLEARERGAGHADRAEFLVGARERLSSASNAGGDLLAALERAASDLAELRAGEALEAQAEVIRVLEELLDYLLERELEEQMAQLLESAAERSAAIEELARTQERLLQETRELAAREQAQGSADADARARLAAEQEKLNEQIREQARRDREEGRTAENTEQAAAAGEQAEREIRSGEQGERNQAEPAEPKQGEQGEPRNGEPSDAQKGEDGEPAKAQQGEQSEPQKGEQSEPQTGEQGEPQKAEPGQPQKRPPGDPSAQRPQQQQQPQQTPKPGENLDKAEENQQEALDRLEREAEQSRQEQAEIENAEKLESLLNVVAESEVLLARHQAVVDGVEAFATEHADRRPPRSARVQLRRWSDEEAALSEATSALLVEVRAHGAAAFPFLMDVIREDHQLLGGRLDAPLYRGDGSSVDLGRDIESNWIELIEAIRTEAERIRRKIQNPQQPPAGGEDGETGEEDSPDEEPLVSFAAELQLLLRMQQDSRVRLDRLRARRSSLAEAGIEFDDNDRLELERLVERQSRLRSLYTAIMEQLEGKEKTQDA